MTHILISTTCRNKPPDQPSGHYFVVDTDTNHILQRSEIIEPPFREHDTNPRGGIRGGKGISIQKEHIILSNSSFAFIYDRHWKPLLTLGHPSLGGIHDLCVQDRKIWLTSTRNDLLFCFDFQGNLLNFIDFRKSHGVFRDFKWNTKPCLSEQQIRSGAIDFRDPRTHDPNRSDTAHLNGVEVLPDGELLVSLGLVINTSFSTLLSVKKWMVEKGYWEKLLAANRGIRRVFSLKKNMHSDLVFQPAYAYSSIVRVTRDLQVKECFSLHGITVPSHSVRLLCDNTAVYLNTTSGEIIHFDPQSGLVFTKNKIGSKFLRGARQLGDGALMLGDNHFLYRYDLRENKILSTLQISPDPDEAIFDIYVLPQEVGLPPLSFPDHHKKFQVPETDYANTA